SQIILRRLHPKLPSQHSFNWTGSPPFPRSFVLRGPLRSPGSSRRQGFLTESQSCRLSRLSWSLSPLSLCHHQATRCGEQPRSFLHPSCPRFAPMSSISIHSQGAGQAVRSITFPILFLVRG